MTAQIKTEQNRFSGELHNLGNTVIHQDLERIEDIHQIKLSLVSLTRKMSTSDTNRLMALNEIIKTLATLEIAQDLIRTAHTN